jgi:hypothetical protein
VADLNRVGVEFTGTAGGAVGAARETALAIDKVKTSAAGSSAPLRGMERDLGRVERGALAGSGAFHGLGRAVAFASGAFLGAAGLTEVIKSSIDVVLRSQTSIALLDRAITNAHANVKALTPILEAHAAAARELGFTDDQTREAEAKLVTAFGATKQSLDELTVAENLARATHEDLSSAARQLILLQEGNARAAKQFGLALPDLTAKQWAQKAAMDGLTVSQERGKVLYDELLPRIKAQAQAYADSPAGKIAEFHAQIQHLQESIGTGLLPVVDKYLTEIDDWLAKSGNQKRVTDDVQKVVHELAGVLGDAKDATQAVLPYVNDVAHALGGWKTTIELIIGLKFASMLTGWAGALEKVIGVAAAGTGLLGAEAAAGGMFTKLRAIQALGPIAATVIVYEVFKHRKHILSQLEHPLRGLGESGDQFIPVPGDNTILYRGGRLYEATVSGKDVPISIARAAKDYGVTAAYLRAQIAKLPVASGTGGGLVSAPGGVSFTGTNPAVSAGLVSTAKSALGVPYAFGGLPSLSKPTDCSGLMVAVFAKNGISIPRTSQAQYASAPIKNQKPLLPGDLVFSEGVHPGHVGLYIGNGQVLEDPHTGDHVKTVALKDFGWNGESARWWGGTQGTGTGGGGGGGGGGTTVKKTSPYGPPQDTGGGGGTAAPAKTKWVGATEATIISAQGRVSALLKTLPATLDPVEQNAVAHIKAIQEQLHVHMPAAELAKDRVELTKWGKVLHDEIGKNAKVVAAAAAEAKKVFDRALSLDVSHVLRDFDESFQAQMKAFETETSRTLKGMQTDFQRQQQLFDRETQAGLQGFVVKQTPEEKALADYIAQRANEQEAQTKAQQQSDLAAAIASGDPAQIKAAQDAINQTLEDDQQRALQDAADASRQAQDAKTQADQQAYQDQRDLQKQALQDAETDREQAYQDQRDAQKQALQDINDDQRIALQNSLDDWVQNLEDKKKSWLDFLQWLREHGFDTGALVNPGPSGSGSGNAPPGATRILTPGRNYAFASGGKVPGHYVGRDDTILARVTPGETVISRDLTNALEDVFLRGGGSDARPIVVSIQIDGREIANAVAQPMTDAQARQIGYTAQRG